MNNSGDQKKCLNSAMRLLATREHSRAELRQKLLDKGFLADEVAGVLEFLVERNFQSDSRFVEAYTIMRANKGFGPLRIRFELRDRGVDDELIEKALNEDSDHWLELLVRVHNKKFGEQWPDDFEEQNQQIKFLIYKGFSFEQIRKCFR